MAERDPVNVNLLCSSGNAARGDTVPDCESADLAFIAVIELMILTF